MAMEIMEDMGKMLRIRQRNRKYIPVVILGGIAAVLIVLAAIVILGEKKVRPTIYFSLEQVDYREGDNFDKLKEGVTAMDGDGNDISDSIYVEGVIPLRNGTEAKVYYVARDAHNNMVKEERIVSYITSGTQGDEKNTVDEENQAKTESIESTVADNANENIQSDGKPVVTLKVDTTTIPVGSAFDIVSFVQDITDDKDSRSDLFKRIMVDGSYDVNQAGTYQLKIYVKDSDGNYSDKQMFALVVN
ncbi:MAG: hypothetical protein ACLRZ7_04400 [Lachnospiraceae bacterium]